MALIKCDECGKDISDTSDKCIHCGCPIQKRKKDNWLKKHKKLFLIVCSISILVIVSIVVIKKLGKDVVILPHTIKNTQLIKLLDYTNPLDIKNDLGNNFKHNTYDTLNSSSDHYENVVIDGKTYTQVEISYGSNGDFERIYLDTDKIWSKSDYGTLVADLTEKYGTDYDYKEEEYNGMSSYIYTWNMGWPRYVSCSIYLNKSEADKYWIRINSMHS